MKIDQSLSFESHRKKKLKWWRVGEEEEGVGSGGKMKMITSWAKVN
jgi:hypothetical protein